MINSKNSKRLEDKLKKAKDKLNQKILNHNDKLSKQFYKNQKL